MITSLSCYSGSFAARKLYTKQKPTVRFGISFKPKPPHALDDVPASAKRLKTRIMGGFCLFVGAITLSLVGSELAAYLPKAYRLAQSQRESQKSQEITDKALVDGCNIEYSAIELGISELRLKMSEAPKLPCLQSLTDRLNAHPLSYTSKKTLYSHLEAAFENWRPQPAEQDIRVLQNVLKFSLSNKDNNTANTVLQRVADLKKAPLNPLFEQLKNAYQSNDADTIKNAENHLEAYLTQPLTHE